MDKQKTFVVFIIALGIGIFIGPTFWHVFRTSARPLQELGRAAWLDTPLTTNKLIGTWVSKDSPYRGVEFTTSGQHKILRILTESGVLVYDHLPNKYDCNYEIHGNWLYFGKRDYSFALNYKCQYEANDSVLVLRHSENSRTEYRRYTVGDTVAAFGHSSLTMQVGLFPTSHTLPVGRITEPSAYAYYHKIDSSLRIEATNISTALPMDAWGNLDNTSFFVYKFSGTGKYTISDTYIRDASMVSYQGHTLRSILGKYYTDHELHRQGYLNITKFDTVGNRCQGNFSINYGGLPMRGEFDVILTKPY